MKRAARWFLAALIFFGLAGFTAFRAQQYEVKQTRNLSEQACHLVGEDRRAMYAVLIELGYTESVPAKTQMVLRRQASDIFRHLDCADIDLNISQVPHIRDPIGHS